jgi:hypothetical protein
MNSYLDGASALTDVVAGVWGYLRTAAGEATSSHTYLLSDARWICATSMCRLAPETPSVWLRERLALLESFRSIGDNADGYGTHRPNDGVLGLAERVLRSLEAAMPPSRVAATADETVLIAFEAGERSGALECYSADEIVASIKLRPGHPSTIWDLPATPVQIRAAAREIQRFLSEAEEAETGVSAD